MEITGQFLTAFIITTIAGLATVLGGFITFVIKKDDLRALSVGLGCSAGVMIFLSFTEILPEAQNALKTIYPNHFEWMCFAGFAAGILIAILIDYFVPDHIDGDDLFVDEKHCNHKHRIKRAGLITALAIAIHNFPEGIATFFMTSQDLKIGLSVAAAIAMHNIPEGIAVALPIYHATGKKRYAVWYSFLSGISEPIGAVCAMFLINLFLPQLLIGFLFAIVAGIMVYISFDTLLPMAKEYGNWHLSIIGIISGILGIWLLLLFLN